MLSNQVKFNIVNDVNSIMTEANDFLAAFKLENVYTINIVQY